MPDQTKDQVNLFDVFAFLLRWRKFILTASLTVAVITAIISFIIPSQYKSTAVIRNQETQSMGLGSLLAGKLGGLGALAGLGNMLGENPEEVTVSILQSRWMSEQVIEHFELRKVYKMEKALIEEVIKELLHNTSFEVDGGSSNIIITVQDKKASRAKEMADFYIEQLDMRNHSLRSEKARKEREFVGARLDEERGRLKMLEDSLAAYSLATGVLNIEEQVKATIQAAAGLEAERLMAKTKLEIGKKLYGEGSAENQMTRLQISSLDSAIQSLIRPREKSDDEFLLSFQDIPKQGLTYLRLMRDIEIQQLLVGFILQMHEQAKLEELRNTPTLSRLDPPAEATKRSWPKRGLMTIIAFITSFIFASVSAYFMEFFSAAKSDPNHPQYARMEKIRQAWDHKK